MTGPTMGNLDPPEDWGNPDIFQADLPGGVRPHRIRYWVGVGDPADHTFRIADHVDTGDVVVGLECSHLRDDGKWCGGYVSWPNDYGVEPTGHTLVSVTPLTVIPSLACRGKLDEIDPATGEPKPCPSHGHITGGKWIGAPD